MSKELDVGVAELGDGSHASTGSAAGQGVGCAGGDLLRGEHWQVAAGDGSVGLNDLSCGKGPAGAALSLVLDIGDGALLPPVHGGGKVLDGAFAFGAGSGGSGKPFVAAKVLSLELSICQVGELVDS